MTPDFLLQHRGVLGVLVGGDELRHGYLHIQQEFALSLELVEDVLLELGCKVFLATAPPAAVFVSSWQGAKVLHHHHEELRPGRLPVQLGHEAPVGDLHAASSRTKDRVAPLQEFRQRPGHPRTESDQVVPLLSAERCMAAVDANPFHDSFLQVLPMGLHVTVLLDNLLFLIGELRADPIESLHLVFCH